MDSHLKYTVCTKQGTSYSVANFPEEHTEEPASNYQRHISVVTANDKLAYTQ
jgi:hypothetical protein